jgi:glycosyltransferase involved in cell wall biosynthesis
VFKRFCDLKEVNQLSITSSITKNNSVSRNELELISKEFYLKYILAILNSSFAYWFLNNYRRAKVVNCFYPDDFRKLPIPKIDKQQQLLFVEQVDKIILNFAKLKKSEVFISRIRTHLHGITITQKIKEFYKYDFKTFLDELKKQKKELKLKQSDEWEEYFNSYAKELNTAYKIVIETNEKLNNLIYALYNLSSDEIMIMKSVK